MISTAHLERCVSAARGCVEPKNTKEFKLFPKLTKLFVKKEKIQSVSAISQYYEFEGQ